MSIPAELLRPFRPRAARWVASVLFVLSVLALPALLLVMAVNRLEMPWTDVVGFTVTAAALAWLCFRQAAVRAVPDDTGITVRNFIRVRRLDWAQVVSVRFGPNSPWAQLDLSDGTTLAVMAVQSADGDHGRREAGRLAALVQLHEPGQPG
ncbi:PH domain-containing protein [Georgenia sp. H159]|uniref:PH domain-containing protein n=1 Tax=Georgenia sp. H159 TaxID=3076115 RepID=UPI002D777ACC|nr:PH domain-containing protein [Georgenia sp. H159]